VNQDEASKKHTFVKHPVIHPLSPLSNQLPKSPGTVISMSPRLEPQKVVSVEYLDLLNQDFQVKMNQYIDDECKVQLGVTCIEAEISEVWKAEKINEFNKGIEDIFKEFQSKIDQLETEKQQRIQDFENYLLQTVKKKSK